MKHLFHKSLTNIPAYAAIIDHLVDGKPLSDIEIIEGDNMMIYIPKGSDAKLSELIEVVNFEELLHESRS